MTSKKENKFFQNLATSLLLKMFCQVQNMLNEHNVELEESQWEAMVQNMIEKESNTKPERLIKSVNNGRLVKAPVKLPYDGTECTTSCAYINKNDGLFVQCTNAKRDGSKFCGRCVLKENRYGTIKDRLKQPMLEYDITKIKNIVLVENENVTPITWAYYLHLHKFNLTDEVSERFEELEIEIPEEQLVMNEAEQRQFKSKDKAKGKSKETKPKEKPKPVVAEDTDTDTDDFPELKKNDIHSLMNADIAEDDPDEDDEAKDETYEHYEMPCFEKSNDFDPIKRKWNTKKVEIDDEDDKGNPKAIAYFHSQLGFLYKSKRDVKPKYWMAPNEDLIDFE